MRILHALLYALAFAVILLLLGAWPWTANATINGATTTRVVLPSVDGGRYGQFPAGDGPEDPLPGTWYLDNSENAAYDFETDADLAEWAEQADSADDIITVTEGTGTPTAPDAYAGTKMVMIQIFNGASPNRSEMYAGPGSAIWTAGDKCPVGKICTVRWRSYFPSGFSPGNISGGSDQSVIMGQIHGCDDLDASDTSTSPSLTIGLKETGNAGPYYWNISAQSIDGGVDDQDNVTYDTGSFVQGTHTFDEDGQWNTWRIEYQQDSNAGYAKVYLNDELIGWKQTGFGLSDTTECHFKIGLYHYSDTTMRVYIDNVEAVYVDP